MASSLRGILKDFTEAINQDVASPLGEEEQTSSVVPLASATNRMTQLAHSNAYMMNIAVAIVVLLFVGCILLVIYYRHAPNTAILVMGGNGLQLLLLVSWLRRLWIEKTTVETLLVAVEALPPAEAAKILVAFYFNATNGK
jgi:hypothetical protein